MNSIDRELKWQQPSTRSTLVFLAVAMLLCTGAFGQTRVILRMDDEGFNRHRPAEGDRSLTDAAITKRVLEIVTSHKASVTLGVIPNVVSGSPSYRPTAPQYRLLSTAPDEVAALREAVASGHAEVAMHGWSHEALSQGDGRSAEFAGLPFEEQLKRLDEGKKELERCLGSPIDIFVPPFNNHDGATLLALEKLQFKCISSSPQTLDTVGSLAYMPYTVTLKDLMQGGQSIGMLKTAGVMNVMFHTQDFVESGSAEAWMSFGDFDTFLGQLAQRPGIEFTTITSEIARSKDTYTAAASQQYALVKERTGRLADLAGVLNGGKAQDILPSTAILTDELTMRRQATLLASFEVLADFIVFGLAATLVRKSLRRKPGRQTARTILLAACVLSTLALILEGLFGIQGAPGFGSRLVLAICACAGASVGVLAGSPFMKRLLGAPPRGRSA